MVPCKQGAGVGISNTSGGRLVTGVGTKRVCEQPVNKNSIRQVAISPASEIVVINSGPEGCLSGFCQISCNLCIFFLPFCQRCAGRFFVLFQGANRHALHLNYLGQLTEMDRVTFPYMEQNMSYSRIPDGSSTWLVTSPTCNLANSNQTSTDDIRLTARMYPTLADNYLIVENAQNRLIRVIDLTGKVLMQQTSNDEKIRLELSNLKPGVYILTAGNEKFRFIKK